MCSARIGLLLFSIFLLLNIKSVSLSNVRYQEMTATSIHFYEHYSSRDRILRSRKNFCNNSTLTSKYGQSHSVERTHKPYICLMVWAYDTSTISDETEDFAIIFTKHERFRNNSRIIDTRLMEDELFSRWAVNSMSREDFDKKIASKRISFKYAACETSETFICNDEVFAQQTSMMSIKNKPNKGAVTSWKEYRAVLRRFWWKLYGNNGTDFDYNLYNTIANRKDPFEEEQSSITKEKTKKKSIAPNRLLLSEDQVDGFQALGLTTVAVALVIILYYLIIYLVVYTYRNRIFVNFT